MSIPAITKTQIASCTPSSNTEESKNIATMAIPIRGKITK